MQEMATDEFKAGDRVVVKQDKAEPFYPYADGRSGTINYVSAHPATYPYEVRLDGGALIHLKASEIEHEKVNA